MQPTSASPFKFLDSYTRADIGDFFGRDKETDELFRQCFLSPILVVYGGSGTGKTSLVQCGLSSRFQDSDWLPVPVRRSGDMIASVREAIHAVTLTPSNSSDLGQLAANLYLDHFKPIYFLFDQFEELFIFGGHAESEAFFAAMRALLEKERNAHILFVVREEYLAELTRYESIIPGLIENRYRVERLTQRHAMEVVEKLCAAHKIPCAVGFSAALVGRLDPEGQGIELSYLQVFLDRCWRTRQDDEPFSPALLERIGHVDDMLGAFLDEQVADTPEPQRSESLLKTFVSDQGTKRQLTSTEAHDWVQTIGVGMELSEVERLLQVLVSKRLLKDRDERGRYELLHDALARQIFQRITRAEQELIEVRQFVQQAHGQFLKRGVKLTANDLTYLRPYRIQLHLKGEVKEFVEGAFGEEERKERGKRLKRRIGFAAVLAVLIATGIYAFQLNRRLKGEKLVNQSRHLAELAMATLSGDPWTAYLLTEEAYRISPTFESEHALVAIYPFLYPEVRRYKGNSFFHMSFSKSLLVIDEANDDATLYDDQGTVRWKEHMPHMKRYVGVKAFDSTGVVLVLGERALLRRVSGEMLFDEVAPDTCPTYETTRQLLLSTRRSLVRLDSLGIVTVFPLDTQGIHQPLTKVSELIADKTMRYLCVKTDSSFHVFDLDSVNLPLLHTWKAPGLLGDQFRMPSPHKCVVHTDQHLYLLDWSTAGPMQAMELLDFQASHVSTTIHWPQFTDDCVVLFGAQNILYDFKHKSKYDLFGMSSSDRILGCDIDLQRYVYQTNSRGTKGQSVHISSFDGSWNRTVASSVQWNGARYEKNDGLLVRQFVDDKDEAIITQLSLSGDTLSSTRLTTSAGGKEHPLSSWRVQKSEVRFVESVQTPDNALLRSALDSSGRVLRFLLPENRKGAFVYSTNNAPGRNYIIYSDSLISHVEMTEILAPTPTDMNWPTCALDNSVQQLEVRNGRVRCVVLDKDVKESSFDIDLHGCLDSIQTESFGMESMAAVLNRRWARVFNFDRRGGLQRGFLVDLATHNVVDTGIFDTPAEYQLMPNGHELLQLRIGAVSVLDTSLNVTHAFRLRNLRADYFQRAGNRLLVLDSLHQGIIDVIDLRDQSMSRRTLQVNDLGDGVLKRMSKDRSFDRVWIDDNNVAYFVLGSSYTSDAIVAIEADGSIAKLDVTKQYISFKWSEREGLRIRLAPQYSRRMNGSLLGAQGAGRYVEYDHGAHAFINARTMDEPNWAEHERSGQIIERRGHPLWNIDLGGGTLCGNYFYSRFRAVDHYEKFPLYGKEVIRLVREEKEFGEFWKHINAKPLINKVLGTEAYNAGYQVGSLMRSTWVKLGLLLGAGVLAYAWWSKRRRLRAT